MKPPPLRSADVLVRTHSGFTLIELTLSASLMVIILSAAYLCLSAALSSQREIEPRVDVIQNARVALALLSADLRSACALSKDTEFLGMHRLLGEVEADNLDFATRNYLPQRPGEGDYCQVSWFVANEGTQYTLWRRRNPAIAPDPLSGGSRELIARGLRGVRFEYYDGWDWYDSWGELGLTGQKRTSRYADNLSGLPDAVRITLWFDPHPSAENKKPADAAAPPPTPTESPSAGALAGEKSATEPSLAFQTVVRLELAAALRSKATSTTSGSSPAPSTTPTPGNPQGN